MKAEAVAAIAGGAVLVGAVYWLTRPGRVADVASGAARVAGEAATGVVLGIGDAVGLPRTDETECEKALREGRKWDASFVCPASTFLKHVFD